MTEPRQRILIAAITCAVLLPFINKAIHIDDPLFVWTAKQIVEHPLDPYGFNVNWYSTPWPMHEVINHPPLTAYWLAMFGGVFSFGEPVLHLAMLIPAVGFSLGVHELARRLAARPLGAALLALASPAVLVSATTLMSDVLMACFWVWAVVLWIIGLRARRHGLLAAAAIAVALAMLTKYPAVSLIPLIGAYTIAQRKRFDVSLFWLLVPVAVVAVWEQASLAMYGHSAMWDVVAYSNRRVDLYSHNRWLVATVFVGGCAAPLLVAAPWLVRWVGMVVCVLIAVAVGLATRSAQSGLWCAVGVLALWVAARELWRRRDAEALLLALWVFGVFVFAARINWVINARTVLSMIPALAVLAARHVPVRPIALAIALGFVLSLTLAVTDYVHAGSQRRGAAIIAERHSGEGGTLWMMGHWGVQYYLQLAGAREVNFDAPSIQPDDRLVLPLGNTNIHPPPRDTLAPLDRVSLPTVPFVALQSRPAGAGFYSVLHVGGPLPFAFGEAPPARFEVLRVVKPVTQINREQP